MKKSLTISALSALILATSAFAGHNSPPAIGTQITDFDFEMPEQIKLSTVVLFEDIENSTTQEEEEVGIDKGNGKSVTLTKKVSVTVNDLLDQSGITGAAKLYEANGNLVVTDKDGIVLENGEGPSSGFAEIDFDESVESEREFTKTNDKGNFRSSEQERETENISLNFNLAPVTIGTEGEVGYSNALTSLRLDARVITKFNGKFAGVVVRDADGEIFKQVGDFGKYTSRTKSNALIGEYYTETQSVKSVDEGTVDSSETGIVSKGNLSAKGRNKVNATNEVVANTVALYEGQVILEAAFDANQAAYKLRDDAQTALDNDVSDPKTPALVTALANAETALTASQVATDAAYVTYITSAPILAIYPLYAAQEFAGYNAWQADDARDDAAVARDDATEARDDAQTALDNDASTPKTPALVTALADAETALTAAETALTDAETALTEAETAYDAAKLAASPGVVNAETVRDDAETARDNAQTALDNDSNDPKTPALVTALADAETALANAETALGQAWDIDNQNRRDWYDDSYGM